MLFEGAVRVGAFRSRPGDPSFATSSPARGHYLVFPRTCVSIQHAGRAAVVSDPTRVMIYNRGQEYVRRAVSPAGDRCEWFAYPAAAIAHARGGADEARPFGDLVCLPSTTRAYALAHAALRGLSDPLFVEEAALALLDAVLATPPRAEPTRSHRELADAARRSIATRFTDGRSLDAIAGELGVSTFHLARVFRRTTGTTLHAYRTELRIRAAIERLPDTDDLAALALDLGFSSHSHFTAAFKKLVGVPPSRARI